MNYFTIAKECEVSYEILHSIFISNTKRVESMEEGMSFVQSIKKKYSDATHNCYAINLFNSEQKCSDDGEPQGTAGQPILQTIKKNNITNIACVVTRYFGGIKLGAGGLVSAYTRSTVDGLTASGSLEMIESVVGSLTLDYSLYAIVNKHFFSIKCKILDTKFSDVVTINFAIPLENKNTLDERISLITSGKNHINYIDKGYFSY